MRQAQLNRRTDETSVSVSLAVDGTGRHEIQTGLGFLDHMLTQVAVHGLFDLELRAEGDLHVDAHHTVEDTALALGEAFHLALGARLGILRAASFLMAMDEALARVVVDLSGRPYAVIRVPWNGAVVGSLATSLIEHFLESMAISARCTVHAEVIYGRDNHHMTEALFKGLGRALDEASQVDPRRSGRVPSSKGRLV